FVSFTEGFVFYPLLSVWSFSVESAQGVSAYTRQSDETDIGIRVHTDVTPHPLDISAFVDDVGVDGSLDSPHVRLHCTRQPAVATTAIPDLVSVSRIGGSC
ncbi:unnamed protein product, partial [Laminaria digitata]